MRRNTKVITSLLALAIAIVTGAVGAAPAAAQSVSWHTIQRLSTSECLDTIPVDGVWTYNCFHFEDLYREWTFVPGPVLKGRSTVSIKNKNGRCLVTRNFGPNKDLAVLTSCSTRYADQLWYLSEITSGAHVGDLYIQNMNTLACLYAADDGYVYQHGCIKNDSHELFFIQ